MWSKKAKPFNKTLVNYFVKKSALDIVKKIVER